MSRRGWFHYEHQSQPVASVMEFRARLARNLALMAGVLGLSLALGVAGYHYIVGVPRLVDCVYNAAMIMGGMGPVLPPDFPLSDAGKWFASFYALYSGVVLLVSVGLLLSPVLHRIMHRLHVETDE